MADKPMGIEIEFRGTTVQFDKTVDNVNRAIKLLQAETARVNRALKFDPNNIELLETKFKYLQQAEKLAGDNLRTYKNDLLKVVNYSHDLTNTENWKKLETKLKECYVAVDRYDEELKSCVDKNGNVTDPTKWQEIRAEQEKTYQTIYELQDIMLNLVEANKAWTDEENFYGVKNAMIKLVKEFSNFRTQVDNAGNSLKKALGYDVVSNLENIAKKANAIGQTFTSIGTALTPVSKLAQTALVGSAQKAIAFEEAFAGVKKTVEGTPKQFNDLAQSIRKMSKEIPATTNEISSVAEVAGQLGVSVDTISEFTRVMIDLGNSTNVTADEAATNIARIFNIVNGGVNNNIGDVQRFGSALVALGNNSATTEQEILAMTTRLAGAGSIYGITNQHLLALATAMSSVGLNAEAGGTAVSTIMNNIEKNINSTTKQAKAKIQAFADLLGILPSQFKKAWSEDAFGTLLEVIRSLDSVRAEGDSVVSVLNEMGVSSIRQTDTMLRLVSAVDQVDEYLVMANDAWNENRALTDEAGKRYETLQSKLTILNNAFDDLRIVVGERLYPVISPTIDKLMELINYLTQNENVYSNTALGLMGIVAVLAPATKTVGDVAYGYGKLADGLKKLAEESPEAEKKMSLMQKTITSLSSKNIFANIKNGLVDIYNQSFNTAEGVVTDTTKSDNAWGRLSSTIMTKIVTAFKTLWTTITKNPIALIITVIAGLIATFIHAYQTSEEFRNKVDTLWATIKANLLPVFKEAIRILTELWEQIKTNLSPVITMLYNAFLDLWGAIGKLLVSVSDFINRLFTALKPILEFLMSILGDIITFLADVALYVLGAVINTIEAIITAITGIIDAIGKVISWASKGIDWLKDLLGLEQKYENVNSYVTGHDYSEKRGGGGRVSVLDYYPGSGGLGLNYGLAGGGMGGTITLNTDFVVNNNGDPINETTVRRWGKLITEVVSDELGRRI